MRRKQAGTGPSRRHIQGSKIAKRLPSVNYSFTVLENRNFLKKNFSKKLHTQKNGPSGAPGLASASPWRAKVSQCRGTERGDPLRFFNIHSVAKHEKIEENKNFHFREKISQCRKKLKGGTLWDFSTSFLSQNIKKNAGGTLWGKIFFRKKSLAVPKNMKGGRECLVSPGMICYAEKQEKPFWFSSLDQIVRFDAINFCRTFVELFWSVRVDRKKRVTIIVAFHFMKRRSKIEKFETFWPLMPFLNHIFPYKRLVPLTMKNNTKNV